MDAWELLDTFDSDEPESKPQKIYSTRAMIENLTNALENGYDELDETDIGDLLQLSVIKKCQK